MRLTKEIINNNNGIIIIPRNTWPLCEICEKGLLL